MHYYHHHHHHCSSSSNTVSPAVFAVIGASAARRNRGNENNEDTSCNPWCPSCGYLRYLVVFLGFLGCVIDYMIRFSLSVTIVAMVKNSDPQHVNSYSCPAAFNATRDAQSTKGAGEYDWSLIEQGIALGAFFLGYCITRPTAGRILKMCGGPTFTVFVAMGLCGILTLLTPTIAALHPLALAALRFVMGMLQGPTFPAVYSIISRWTLPDERVTRLSVTFSGNILGALVSLGLSGLVIKSLGWRWVFWGSGILTLVFAPFWGIYVRDMPRHHPGISNRELQRFAGSQSQPKEKFPWRRILKSRQIYLYIMMEFAAVWMQGVIFTEGPTFLTTQIGIDLQREGMVNLAVTGAAWIMCGFFVWFSKLLERREWLTVANIRRLVQGIGMVIVAGSSGLVIAGCDTILVAVYFILLGLGISATFVSQIMGPMDIAPNYADTLSGIVGLGSLAGFLSPLLVSLLMDKKNGWLIIFVVSASIYGVASILYIIGVSAKEEDWNEYEEMQGTDDTTTTRERRK